MLERIQINKNIDDTFTATTTIYDSIFFPKGAVVEAEGDSKREAYNKLTHLLHTTKKIDIPLIAKVVY